MYFSRPIAFRIELSTPRIMKEHALGKAYLCFGASVGSRQPNPYCAYTYRYLRITAYGQKFKDGTAYEVTRGVGLPDDGSSGGGTSYSQYHRTDKADGACRLTAVHRTTQTRTLGQGN